MKRCARCREELPLDKFYRQGTRRGGKGGYCKKCVSEYGKQEWWRGWMYGLTREQFASMQLQQNGLCAICGRPPKENTILHVDHDHSSGAVRGLLCGPCNRMLGLSRDSTETLRNAIQYLENCGN